MTGFGSADIEVVDLGYRDPVAPTVTATLSSDLEIDVKQLGDALAKHYTLPTTFITEYRASLATEMHRLEAIFGVTVEETPRRGLHVVLAIPTPGGSWKCAYCDVTREFVAEVKAPFRYLANRLEELAMSPEHCELRSRGGLPESMTFWQYGKPWDGMVK